MRRSRVRFPSPAPTAVVSADETFDHLAVRRVAVRERRVVREFEVVDARKSPEEIQDELREKIQQLLTREKVERTPLEFASGPG